MKKLSEEEMIEIILDQPTTKMIEAQDLTIQEKLWEAEAYIERQKEYIDQLEHEKQMLYGRLNMIRDLTCKKIT